MRGNRALTAMAVVMGAAAGQAGSAQMPDTIGHAATLAIISAPALRSAGLRVTSPAFADRSAIPIENTQYGANRFPGATWTPGPKGTRSYAVVIQGTVGANASDGLGTSIHLTVLNLPAGTTSLPAGLTTLPPGAAYGPNVHGPHAPYAGPHTHNPSVHEYHLQVFALDTVLPESLGFDALTAAMRGHVLASGEVVGLASMPANAPVQVESGLVSGIAGRDPAITVFKGVPYAAPPIGDLRWRAPARPAAWDGVRAANRFGAACPQPTPEMSAGAAMSEDCLTLNIWAPPATAEKRPVYVWIYGGGFIGGTGSAPEFDGEGLARKGVIVVTFNYRVGVMGFLATPELSRESGHGASGNYGIQDDIAALQWVQRNIAAFGGDPAKVTIGGQSAGAGSVGFLSTSPLAKGLFRAAIAESHARYPRDTELRYLSVSWRPLKSAEAAGVHYADAHGGHTLAQLRAMPWQDLVKGSNTIDDSVETGSTGKPPLFRPVVDGWVIPHNYNDAFAAGTQNDVLYVAGNNRDETGAVPETAFAGLRANTARPRAGMPPTSVTLAAYVANARRKFGPLTANFLRLYPATTGQEAALQNNASARDNSRISTYLWGTLWAKRAKQPIYTYFWTHAPPGASHDTRGAYHGSEINYAFGNLYGTDRPWTDEDRRIAQTMSSYWANIIATGDPNGTGLPEWPAYDPRKPQVMELGDHFAPIPIASPDKVAFWKRFFATQEAW